MMPAQYKQAAVLQSGVELRQHLTPILLGKQVGEGITPDQAEDFLERLPIGKFHSIGRKTAEKSNGWASEMLFDDVPNKTGN